MSALHERTVSITETGTLGVLHLKRLWWTRMNMLKQRPSVTPPGKGNLDTILLDGLGLGVVEPDQFLLQHRPTFEEFENWIVHKLNGRPSEETINWLNDSIHGYLQSPSKQYPLDMKIDDPVLTHADLEHWQDQGYVVFKNAISPEDAWASERAVWEFLGKNPDQPETWYSGEHQFWVPLFQHPTFIKNRNAPRIHKAFAQLWGTEKLLASVDRASMNLPRIDDGITHSGPSALHWDASIAQPMPFGVQGILYLTDTQINQGAFQCVPGFHHKMGQWLERLPAGTDPRTEALKLEAIPVAAGAGDLIIWRHELPHGSSVNTASYPRVAQYLYLYPADAGKHPVWK